MLKHYIKFAFRNFRSNKVIFAGSLATLCLGALCISLLFSYVHNELTMDDFHKKEQDIYMLVSQVSPVAKKRSMQLSRGMGFNYKEYPEVKTKVGIADFPEGELRFEYKNSFYAPQGLIVDSTFFQVFDFNLKFGNKHTILQDPNAIIFTERFAKKIFGNDTAIEKKVILHYKVNTLFTVKGIVETPPANSSIGFDFLLPRHDELSLTRMGADFMLMNKGFDKKYFEDKIEKNIQTHHQYKKNKASIISFNELYFNEEGIRTNHIIKKNGNHKNVFILIIIMFVVFIISALNLSNLQIINTNTSLKHLSVNLIHGALNRHLIYQKIIEAIILVFIATLITLIAYQITLPFFNNFIQIPLTPSIWSALLYNAIIIVLLTLLALLYPIYITNKNSIINGLKKQVFGVKVTGKKVLITVQYGLTIVLLICAIIVTKQLGLMLSKELGFTKENIIKTKMFYEPKFNTEWRKLSKEEINKKREEALSPYKHINNELASNVSIINFSQGDSPLKTFKHSWKLKDKNGEFTTQNATIAISDYEKVFGLKLLEGVFFEKGKENHYTRKVVINEAAKKYWNINDISKERLINNSWGEYKIIGVVKDFNYEHLSTKPQPLVIVYQEHEDSDFLIRFQEGTTESGLQFVADLFDKANPGETFKYTFLSDGISALYQKEKRLSTIYIVFTIIALLISAIGLFTIALHDTQRRIKEIGVRKVNGATIKEVILMLNKDFVKWVGIAFVIACPIAYYTMSKWLETFAYKTALSWWVFAWAGVFTLTIALLTVSWQSYRAATRNPVESLRDE